MGLRKSQIPPGHAAVVVPFDAAALYIDDIRPRAQHAFERLIDRLRHELASQRKNAAIALMPAGPRRKNQARAASLVYLDAGTNALSMHPIHASVLGHLEDTAQPDLFYLITPTTAAQRLKAELNFFCAHDMLMSKLLH
jgi:hypothetical protein